MYLTKTRAVPFSEEKTDQKKPKQYYRPPRYSRKRKTPALFRLTLLMPVSTVGPICPEVDRIERSKFHQHI